MTPAGRRRRHKGSPWLGILLVVAVAAGACGEGERPPTATAASTPGDTGDPETTPPAKAAGVCGAYRTGGNAGLPPDTTGDGDATDSMEAISGPEGEVGANSSAAFPVRFEGSAEGGLVVFVDKVDEVTATFVGVRLEPTDLLGSGVLQATLHSPKDGEIQVTNASSSSTTVSVMILLKTARRLSVTTSPESAPAGRPVNIAVELSEPAPEDAPCALVKNEHGVETQVELERARSGSWTATYVPPAAGGYVIDVWVAEPRPRFAEAGLLVS